MPPKNMEIPKFSIAGYTKPKDPCGRLGKRSVFGGVKGTKGVSEKVREMTPEPLAVWLVEIARRCSGASQTTNERETKRRKKAMCLRCWGGACDVHAACSV